MQSVSEDRIKGHFMKRFFKQNRSVSNKKEGDRGPQGPSPKTAYRKPSIAIKK